jgi:hypothetical protein
MAVVQRIPVPDHGIKHIILRFGPAIHEKCGVPRTWVHPVIGRRSDIVAGTTGIINAWKILRIAGSGTMDIVALFFLSDNFYPLLSRVYSLIIDG